MTLIFSTSTQSFLRSQTRAQEMRNDPHKAIQPADTDCSQFLTQHSASPILQCQE